MDKSLIISYYFPPFTSGGVIRVHSFVKFLPQFGVMPVVLSASIKEAPAGRLDNTFTRQYHDGVKIYRTREFHFFEKFIFNPYSFRSKASKKSSLKSKLLKFFRGMVFPDQEAYWILPAIILGTRVINKNKCTSVFVTAPPHSSLIVAYILSIMHKLPLIIDFRDDWIGNPYYVRNDFLEACAKFIERRIITRSKVIITVTENSYGMLAKRYHNLDKNIVLIPNGFDPDYVSQINNKKKNKITFFYGGTLTKNRDPRIFLEAAKEYCIEHELNPHNICFEFVGSMIDPEFLSSLKSSEYFNVMPNMEYESYQRYISDEIDVFIIFQSLADGGNTAIPGKLYDAIIRKKPILAVTEGGAVDGFLKEYHLAVVVTSDDKHIIKEGIGKSISLIKETFKISPEFIRKYSRKEHTNQLAGLIKEKPKMNTE